MSDTNALNALCPLDGRYWKTGNRLRKHFNEQALIGYRLKVMYGWLMFLIEHPDVPTPTLTDTEKRMLLQFDPAADMEAAAKMIKLIEMEGYGKYPRTNHDVKACEFYLRITLNKWGLTYLDEWLHFGCTSEDVNNVAYALMLDAGFNVLLEELALLQRGLNEAAAAYADIPMLARTHGQPATPTTLGKEFAVFGTRLYKLVRKFSELEISVKWNGASGNYNAVYAALPKIQWEVEAENFCNYLARSLGRKFVFNTHTTQIEPHDAYAEHFDALCRINTMLIGLCQDMWRYISDEWLVQKAVEGEVGSSAMPHKVNPIDDENAEGNFAIANALLQCFSRKLPISRLQRDLSDSTVERNFGMALGYCLKSYESLNTGLRKINANRLRIRTDLDAHPEILAEAYQTILRVYGYPDAYGTLKDVVRGKKVTLQDLHAWIRTLDVVEEVKEHMLALTPQTYVGLAPKLATNLS
jgi:adenylosuccinate lyase